MRSPVTKYKSFWLGCLFIATLAGFAWADSSGEITGVTLDAANKRVVVASKGAVGKHSVRVVGQPNRLILDLDQTSLGKAPRKIAGGKIDIHEIRVGAHKSSARLVVDFRDMPVPAFKVHREDNQILIAFGNSVTGDAPETNTASAGGGAKKDPAPLEPAFVPAAAGSGMDMKNAAPTSVVQVEVKPAGSNLESEKVDHATKAGRPVKLAQADTSLGRSMPGRAVEPARSSQTAGNPGPPPGGPQMVKEVRPPVTPPTPDPRLLVQEITELKFIQVGHNSRLIVRGGDHMDYRLNKVTPTKARLDLINAEIPKAYQKPLRTDLFSTSVEMIVPGSQTIFLQLKDAVPYQVEKQKGVLMIDFPPPRFSIPPEKAKGTDIRAMQEANVHKSIDLYMKRITSVSKQEEELRAQRSELIKRYQLTPDPEVFAKPVTMDFQGIELKNAFRLLAEQAGVNIVMGDDVKGTVTLKLFQVPLGQVIDTILRTHNLGRVMIGNVMRVDRADRIQKYETDKRTEEREALADIDKRIEEARSDKRAAEDKITSLQKELERLAAAQAEGADTRSEEIADAGCIDIEGEKVCFVFTSVKVVFANPRTIAETLDCMFNFQCRGALSRFGTETYRLAGPTPTNQLPGAQAAIDSGFSPSTPLPSSTPGLPPAVIQQQAERDRRLQLAEQQTRAAQIAALGALGQPGAQLAANLALPLGTDPKLVKIILHSVIAPDAPNRMIFLRDTPERVAQMKKIIYSLDVPTPQVLIESRLVQADRDWSRGIGVLWGGSNNHAYKIAGGRNLYWGVTGNQAGGAANQITPAPAGDNVPTMTPVPSRFAVNLPPTVANLTNLMGLGVTFGLLAGNYATELDLRIQLGEANGQTKTIARPKVQVLDNETASIKNGRTIAYSTVSLNGTQTQLVNVDLLLNVRPTIYTDGRVRMRIQVTDNDVAPDLVNGQASILTREANTIMIVKDGETAVIGGIVRKTEGASRQGWPGLMNVPIINTFFSAKSANKRVQELLVFITPTIVKRPPNAS
jgi:type IV pilus assembly protein PilQ